MLLLDRGYFAWIVIVVCGGLALARPVEAAETSREEVALLTEALDSFDRAAALLLVSAGESARNEALDIAELAAYQMVASLILNLDGTITRN